MKALVLTNIELDEIEKKKITETKIFKLALNQHAQELKPDLRICSDFVAGNLIQKFEQKIVSTREYFEHPRLIYCPMYQFKGSTIVSAIEYLLDKGFRKILIVGDNTVHSSIFQKRVNDEIEKVKYRAEIFQFRVGNFNLKVKSIDEFLNERK